MFNKYKCKCSYVNGKVKFPTHVTAVVMPNLISPSKNERNKIQIWRMFMSTVSKIKKTAAITLKDTEFIIVAFSK